MRAGGALGQFHLPAIVRLIVLAEYFPLLFGLLLKMQDILRRELAGISQPEFKVRDSEDRYEVSLGPRLPQARSKLSKFRVASPSKNFSNLDPIDEMLLLSVDQRLSMTEMCERTGLKSTNTIANRLKNLEKLGLINPPRRFRLARSRTLTSLAVQVLKANGHQVNTRDTGFTSNFQR
jgi:hypothetical protein